MRIFILFIAFLFFSSGMSAQVKPLDTAAHTFSNLKAELDPLYDFYNAKYPEPDLRLRAVTLYAYNNKNEQVNERAFSKDDSYSLYLYENKQRVKEFSSFMGRKTITVTKYEGERKTEKTEFYDYKTSTEKYKSESNRNGDTVTARLYTNDRLQWKFVTIDDPSKNMSEIYRYQYDENKLYAKDVIYFSDQSKKHLEKEHSFKYHYNYEEETVWHFDKAGREIGYTVTNLTEHTSKEYKTYYDEKGYAVKKEDLVNGQLSSTNYLEYDAKGHLIKEKCIGAKGTVIYQCIYEYDEKGNKILYLYFYMG